MNRISWMSLLSVVALVTVQLGSASERVDNFALLDHEGSYHQLRKYGDNKAVVIISIASTCVENIDKLPKYRLLRTTWEQQGITFLGLDSSVEDEQDDVRLMDALHNFDIPILLDKSQLVAENLGISKAGEVIVLEPNRFQVLYRGGLDIDRVRARPNLGIAASAGTTTLADTLHTQTHQFIFS